MKVQDQHQIKPETQSCQTSVSGSVSKKELRIGNWMFVDDMLNNHIICSIRETMVNVEYIRLDNKEPHCSLISIDRLKGIELNNNCLANLGFKKRQFLNDWFIEIPNSKTILIYKDGEAYICEENKQPCLYIKCKFAHTIQNIYYSLSGFDLTDR